MTNIKFIYGCTELVIVLCADYFISSLTVVLRGADFGACAGHLRAGAQRGHCGVCGRADPQQPRSAPAPARGAYFRHQSRQHRQGRGSAQIQRAAGQNSCKCVFSPCMSVLVCILGSSTTQLFAIPLICILHILISVSRWTSRSGRS